MLLSASPGARLTAGIIIILMNVMMEAAYFILAQVQSVVHRHWGFENVELVRCSASAHVIYIHWPPGPFGRVETPRGGNAFIYRSLEFQFMERYLSLTAIP